MRPIILFFCFSIFSCQHQNELLTPQPYESPNFDVSAYFKTDSEYLDFLNKGACAKIDVKMREIELLELKFEDNLLYFDKLKKTYLGDCALCKRKATAYYFFQLKIKKERIDTLKLQGDKIRDPFRIEKLKHHEIIQRCNLYWNLLDKTSKKINDLYRDNVNQTILDCGSFCDEEKLKRCAGFEIREDLTLRELEKIFQNSSAICYIE